MSTLTNFYLTWCKNIKTPPSLIYSVFRDMYRFWRSAHLFNAARSQKTAKAHIFRLAHALEKGMAMPEPRPGFGLNKLSELLQFTHIYCDKWGVDHEPLVAVASIASLLKFHGERATPQPLLQLRLDRLVAEFPDLGASMLGKALTVGNRRLTRDEVLKLLPPNPEGFFFSRQSVRQFDVGRELDPEIFERAVRLAQRAPSVCNRQSGRVYIYTDPELMTRVLKYQDGNSGFGSTAAAILVCTADLSCFYKPGERNQGFVDGGLFAMSLVYALHALGIGSCMLNWSQPIHKDDRFRRVANIPYNEVIITMIAAGPLREEFEVASSPRRPLEDVLQFNPPLLPLK